MMLLQVILLAFLQAAAYGMDAECQKSNMNDDADGDAFMQIWQTKKAACPGGDQSQCNLCSSDNPCLCNPAWAVACSNPGDEAACTAAGGTYCTDFPTTSPAPPPAPVPEGALMGEWVTDYGSVGEEPYPDASIQICFNGEATFQENYNVCESSGFNYLSIGGGPGFVPPTADEVASMKGGPFEGLSLDIEGYPSQDVQAISDAFQAAKDAGLKTHFTCAHTGYGLSKDFVTAVLALPTLDYASPQLYTTSPCIQDTESTGITWADWKDAVNSEGATAQILPGVPQGDFQAYASYDSITDSFCTSSFGTACPGVVVWPTVGQCNGDRDWSYN